MSSIATLIEAAKYVDKSETTKSDDKTLKPDLKVTTAMATDQSKQMNQNNGILKHWRKRAVAQSVMESQTRDLQEKSTTVNSVASTSQIPVLDRGSDGTEEQIGKSASPKSSVEDTQKAPRGEEGSPSSTLAPTSSDQLTPQQTSISETLTTFSIAVPQFSYSTVHPAISVTDGRRYSFPIEKNVELEKNGHGSQIVGPISQISTFPPPFSLGQSTVHPTSEVPTPPPNSVHTSSIRPTSHESFDQSSTHSVRMPKDQHFEIAEAPEPLGNHNMKKNLSGQTYQNYQKIDKQKAPSGAVTREAHNLLEKNRRAHLKECFDNLRQVVPSLGTRKVSNLTILREARKYIKTLKLKEQKFEHDVEGLAREKIKNQEKLSTLRRKVALRLEPSVIEEILKVNESNDDIIRQLTSPPKSSLTDYNTSTSSEKEDSPGKALKKQQLEETSNLLRKTSHEIAQVAKTSLSELIDKKPNNVQIVPGMDSPMNKFLNQKPDQNLPQFSVRQVQYLNHNKTGSTPSFILPVTASQMPWSSVYKSDVNGNSLHQIGSHQPLAPYYEMSSKVHGSPLKRDSGTIYGDHAPVTTWKLSQISANYVDSIARPSVESTISATVHRVQSLKPHKTRVVTSELTSFIDTGNGVNPLKIVVKPVESAKQHALGSKDIRVSETNRSTARSGTSRPRQTELVFRPRSSMTPPPPSKITPYFPRFSVGSGGSPPLTTNMNDNSQQGQEQMDQDKQQDALMSQNQITMWRTPPELSKDTIMKSPKRFNNMTLKRKSATEKETTAAKVLKSISSSTSTYTFPLHRIISTDSNLSPHANSDTDSETETTFRATSSNVSAQKTQASVTMNPALSTLLTPSAIRPVNQNKSVTQVCYSTLLKAAKPTIPSASAMKKQPEQHKNTGSPSAWPKVEYLTAQMPMLNANMQIRAQTPQVAYQIVQPAAFMNQAIIQAPVSAAYVNLPQNTPTAAPSSPVKPHPEPSNKGSGETDQAGTPTNNEESTQKRVTVVQQPQNVTPAQMPQIQYVIPMGFAGMMGNSSQQMGFSPAMGGFMPMAPMPQGQGWSYVVPQNMVVPPNAKALSSPGLNTVVERRLPSTKEPETPSVQEDLPVASGANHDKNQVFSANFHQTERRTVTPTVKLNTVSSPPCISISQETPPDNRENSVSNVLTDVSAVPTQAVGVTTSDTQQTTWVNVSRSLQPQFQIIRPSFQTANQIMIPVGAAGPGGGYIIGGAPAAMPAAQGVATVPRSASNMSYTFPMNIVGYPTMQIGPQPIQIGPQPMQIAALPNGAFNIPRGMTYGIAGGMPAQIMTLDTNKQGSNQGGSSNPSANANSSEQ